MNLPCVVDADCPGNSVCFYNASWFDVTKVDTYEGHSPLLPLGCMCSAYYGNTGGPNCYEANGFMATYWLGFTVTLSILALMIVLYITYILWQMARYNLSGKNTVTFALLQLGLGTIAMIVAILSWGSSPFLKSKVVPETGEKTSPVNNLGYAFLAICILSTTSGAATVSLTWIEVARKSRRLVASKQGSIISPRAEKFIYAYEAIFLVAIAVCLALQLFDYLPYVLVPFELVLIALYVFGAYTFTALLKEMAFSLEGSRTDPEAPPSTKDTSGDPKRSAYRALAQEIRVTAGLSIFGFVFALVTSISIPMVYLTLGTWRDAMSSDRPAVLLLWPFQFFGTLAVLLALTYHLKCTVDRLRIRKAKVNIHPNLQSGDSSKWVDRKVPATNSKEAGGSTVLAPATVVSGMSPSFIEETGV